jgi:hypothetical protein
MIEHIRVGFLVMIVPMYQAELCHPKIRGMVTTLQQFMLGIGALIASSVSFGMSSNESDIWLTWNSCLLRLSRFQQQAMARQPRNPVASSWSPCFAHHVLP